MSLAIRCPVGDFLSSTGSTTLTSMDVGCCWPDAQLSLSLQSLSLISSLTLPMLSTTWSLPHSLICAREQKQYLVQIDNKLLRLWLISNCAIRTVNWARISDRAKAGPEGKNIRQWAVTSGLQLARPPFKI